MSLLVVVVTIFDPARQVGELWHVSSLAVIVIGEHASSLVVAIIDCRQSVVACAFALTASLGSGTSVPEVGSEAKNVSIARDAQAGKHTLEHASWVWKASAENDERN